MVLIWRSSQICVPTDDHSMSFVPLLERNIVVAFERRTSLLNLRSHRQRSIANCWSLFRVLSFDFFDWYLPNLVQNLIFFSMWVFKIASASFRNQIYIPEHWNIYIIFWFLLTSTSSDRHKLLYLFNQFPLFWMNICFLCWNILCV